MATSLGADPPLTPREFPRTFFWTRQGPREASKRVPKQVSKKWIPICSRSQPQENPKGPPKLAPKSANGQFSSPGPDILPERLPGPTGIPPDAPGSAHGDPWEHRRWHELEVMFV